LNVKVNGLLEGAEKVCHVLNYTTKHVAQQRLCCAASFSNSSVRAEIDLDCQGCSKNDVWLKQTKAKLGERGAF
jgi:hypothetical protein